MTNTNIFVSDFSGPINSSGASYSVIIDPERRAVWDWSHVGRGVPAVVWHRRALRLRVPASAHPASLRAAVLENIELVEEIISTYRGPVWDGNNYVGEWQSTTEDGYQCHLYEAAEALLEQLFEQVPGVVDAGDWFGYSAHRLSDLLELADVEGKTLSAIAAALIEDAEQQGDVFFSDDKQEQVEELLQRLASDELEELGEEYDCCRWHNQLLRITNPIEF